MKRIATLLLLVACSSGTPPPAGLLSREQFKHVLLEAQLIEARLNHEMVVGQRTDSPIEQYYDSMFVKEGITEEAFRITFDHYAESPEELKAIYNEILTELAQRKDSVR